MIHDLMVLSEDDEVHESRTFDTGSYEDESGKMEAYPENWNGSVWYKMAVYGIKRLII